MKTDSIYFQVHHPWRLKQYPFLNIGKDHNYLDDPHTPPTIQQVTRTV